MTEIILAFVTGLTTGGLSCLAVQGGLLASSLAQQVETGLTGKGKQPKLAAPILWFLVAKIAAYTLLGLVLGAIGSVINLTPTARGIFQLAIGVFMIGQALRILNVHPFFRHFNIETPYFIRKYIRSKTTGEQSNFAPALLGALTGIHTLWNHPGHVSKCCSIRKCDIWGNINVCLHPGNQPGLLYNFLSGNQTWIHSRKILHEICGNYCPSPGIPDYPNRI